MHWYVRGVSCKPNIFVSWSTSELRVGFARHETGLSPPVKYFYWPSQGGASFVNHCLVFVILSRASVYWNLWSPAGKRLTSWPSYVMSSCEVVTVPLISWVRCGAWSYPIHDILPLFLTFIWEGSQCLWINMWMFLVLSCQPRVTVASCFVYKVIMDL